MSVAPHRWSLWYCRLPVQGHSPLRAVTPPTILLEPSAGRVPQSGAKATIRPTQANPHRAECRAESLTAVGLVGLVGAVLDAVTLRVDLGDAGGGVALEVSTAVGRWEI